MKVKRITIEQIHSAIENVFEQIDNSFVGLLTTKTMSLKNLCKMHFVSIKFN